MRANLPWVEPLPRWPRRDSRAKTNPGARGMGSDSPLGGVTFGDEVMGSCNHVTDLTGRGREEPGVHVGRA